MTKDRTSERAFVPAASSQQAVSPVPASIPDAMRVHDYTWQGWGHAIHSPKMHVETVKQSWGDRLLGRPARELVYLSALIHGRNPTEGDGLLLKMESGKVARFIIRDILWLINPRDMWKIKRADFDAYVDTPTPSHGETQ